MLTGSLFVGEEPDGDRWSAVYSAPLAVQSSSWTAGSTGVGLVDRDRRRCIDAPACATNENECVRRLDKDVT